MSTLKQLRILEHLTTAVLLLDKHTVMHYLNPAAEALLGQSAHQLLGHAIGSVFVDLTDCQDIHQVLATGIPYTEREKRLALHGGRVITVDCTVTPVDDFDRRPTVLMELVQVDHFLRISREEQLLTQQTATRALVRGIAHEIKNPLGGLRGAAQLLDSELDDDSLHEYTNIIINEADRLHNLVDRMLGPNNLPVKQDLNIHTVIEHVLNLVRAEAPMGVSLRKDYDPSIPDISADRDLLIQAILNIVRNAMQAVGEQGEVTVRSRIARQFTIGHKRHKLVMNIDIIDNGPGIPDDMLNRIFYPMVTGREGGTGLGLSLAQTLINQHNGLIECNSQPGSTVFSIFLPMDDSYE